MELESDRLPLFLGIIGLATVGYAISLTLENSSVRFFYAFLGIQIILLLYLLYVVLTRARDAWIDYRWSPDRLK
jgi:amino acid permease